MLQQANSAINVLFSLVFAAFFLNVSHGQQVSLGPNIIPIDGSLHIELAGFNKIKSDFPNRSFEIKNGSLEIKVSGIIDRLTEPKLIINLFAEVINTDELIILSARDTQTIQYKVEGLASGSYAGMYNTNGCFLINTSFKIVAPEHPSYLLVLPISICVPYDGKVNYNNSLIGGSGYIYDVKAAKKKRRIKEGRQS